MERYCVLGLEVKISVISSAVSILSGFHPTPMKISARLFQKVQKGKAMYHIVHIILVKSPKELIEIHLFTCRNQRLLVENNFNLHFSTFKEPVFPLIAKS
jgi:hypothetical protein